VKPTVYEFPTTQSYLQHMDELGVERALVIFNYGILVQQPFSLHDLVLDSVKSSDRRRGGLWVLFLPQNKEMTLPLTDPLGLSAEVAADEVHSLRVSSEQAINPPPIPNSHYR
jgi:hypothetical protein